MNKKEKDLHIYSVFAFLVAVLAFWLLDGGTKAGAEELDAGQQIQTPITLPEASDKEIADSRLGAMEQASESESRRRRRHSMQNNSFDWLEAGLAGDKKTEKEAEQAAQDPAESLKSSVEKAENSPREPEPEKPKKESRAERKKRREEEKRRRLEEIERKLTLSAGGSAATEPRADIEPVPEPEPEPEPEAAEAPKRRRSFHGLGGGEEVPDGHIKAVVHGAHNNVTSGSVIKLRLLEDVETGGCKIRRNSFVYGRLTFSSGRAMVRMENINYRDRIVPFKGSIYDRDGFEGLYVPDNVVSKTKKDAGSQAVSSANLRINSTSALVSSAANAVTGAVKSAVATTIRDPKISISANYLITIKLSK